MRCESISRYHVIETGNSIVALLFNVELRHGTLHTVSPICSVTCLTMETDCIRGSVYGFSL